MEERSWFCSFNIFFNCNIVIANNSGFFYHTYINRRDKLVKFAKLLWMFLAILLQVSLWYVHLRGRESTKIWREHLLPCGTFVSKCLLLELQMPVDKFKIKSFSEEVDAQYYSPRQIRKQAEQANKGIYILKHERR